MCSSQVGSVMQIRTFLTLRIAKGVESGLGKTKHTANTAGNCAN